MALNLLVYNGKQKESWKMKNIKRKLVLSVFAVLSVLILAGNGWAYVILPHAFYNGLVETYLDNGVNDDLIFSFATINSVVYSDLSSTGNAADDSIIGKTVTITGAKRIPLATQGTTFTDATLSITDGAFTYYSATLTNLEFVLISGMWRLNPGLDSSNPSTLNLENIVLNPGPIPSAYILDLQAALGSQTTAGMQMTLHTFNGDITGNSQSAILGGLLTAGAPIPEPASVFLFITGAAILGFSRRLQNKRKKYLKINQ